MSPDLQHLLAEADVADRHRLGILYRRLAAVRTPGEQRTRLESELLGLLRQSVERAATRWRGMPAQVEVAAQLPIAAHAAEIGGLLAANQVIVVAGETGSGKTTQLPKICLQAGLGRYGLIGHTQPRRLAAVSVATRIAEELAVPLGAGVGYQVRFNDSTSPATCIKLMTDGILLNEIQQDRFLNRYQAIIVDEAHERSLNIDFILGYLRQLLPRRPDLKLIITSATIDLEVFSKHFGNAPIVSVSGRTYPVEIRYEPLDSRRDAAEGDAQSEGVLEALRQIRQTTLRRPGASDVLVFFSSEKEIREAALQIRRQRIPGLEVLPLYARLRQSDQLKIFQPHKGQRVILATNIAETSLTVPGIRYVIDTGLARISRYSLQSKIQRLPVEAISQASANQRAGRCGRVAEGICIRLYSEQDFQGRPRFTDPEIRRTNLAAVILQMIHLGLGDVGSFPFLDPPEPKAINDGFKLLFELGALDAENRLTSTGQTMARLPVDPRFARILIAASASSCLTEMAIIISFLSVQDPRDYPAELRQDAREKHARFQHPESDFLGIVSLWKEVEQRRQELGSNQLAKYCRQNFLSLPRLREWRETHYQLVMLCEQLKLRRNRAEAGYRDLHTAFLAGSLNQLGLHSEGNDYLGSRNRRFRLLQSSGLARKPPKWIVCAQLLETELVFAGMAAKVEPEWIESVAGHLSRKSWHEPHWSSKQQRVMATEKVTLYGLTLVETRKVGYSEIDPVVSRELFIREALAGQQLESSLPFYRHNRELMRKLEKEEEKLRKQSLFIDEKQLERYYDARIPEDVWDTDSLSRWYRQACRRDPRLLHMQREDLLDAETAEAIRRQFPDRARLHNNALRIEYQFKPGSQSDGATLEVPVPLLGQLTRRDLDWAVPGQLRERCIHMLRSLPKSVRKALIPIPALVDEILPALAGGDRGEELADALVSEISRVRAVQIGREMLAGIDLPEHLRIKLKLIDEKGKPIDLDADLASLQRKHASQAEILPGLQAQNTGFTHPLVREGMSTWELDELPLELEVGTNLRLIRFPALLDRLTAVDVQLLPDRLRAQRETRFGLARLLMLQTRPQASALGKSFKHRLQRWGLKCPAFLSPASLEHFLFSVYAHNFGLRGKRPTTRAEFDALLSARRGDILLCGEEVLVTLDRVVQRHFVVASMMRGLGNSEPGPEVMVQLAELLPPDFLASVDYPVLREFPRYLQALEIRIEKFPGQADKDRALARQIAPHWDRLLALRADGSVSINRFVEDDPVLAQIRWMIEEFRVSLYGQQLGTRVPVSAKRLDKLWQEYAAGRTLNG